MEDSQISSTNNGIFIEDQDALSGYSAIFEDDGRVAYAYLQDGHGIVADVWLYNHGIAPSEPEWRDPSKMPFANPQGFASEDLIKPVNNKTDVQFQWAHDQDESSVAVNILIRGEVFGRLVAGSKPGWSKMAIKDGPLA